jgi:hypothetical protein
MGRVMARLSLEPRFSVYLGGLGTSDVYFKVDVSKYKSEHCAGYVGK